jgi:cytochrome c peroxidase
MRPFRLARALLWFCLAGAIAAPAHGADDDLDGALERVIAARGLEPLEMPPLVPSPTFRLGQMLFFDPILSGTRDVACATCHLLGRGTSDGVDLAVGVDAAGLAEERRPLGEPRVHPRNSMDLWNRGHESVRNMFWDGRVSEVDAPVSRFQTPMMDYLPDGIESVLAAQALFPLAGEEEMLGLPGDRSATALPGGHGDKPNEIALAAAGLDEDEPAFFVAVHEALMRRLLGQAGTPLADWQIAYRRLVTDAFPDTLLGAVTMSDLANAMGHFQALAFVTRDTPWDRYLGGDRGAIGRAAKEGALLFYGKARCAACHSGPLLSDFQFHSLAVPQIGPGIDVRGGDDQSGDDRGRYEATRIPRHLYQFRTPPLRNVTLTGPYFHSGAVASLEEAIALHLSSPDPSPYETEAEAARRASFSRMLRRGIALDEDERANLLAFLQSLEDDQAGARALIVPDSVPSGLPVPALDDAR